MAQRLTYKPDLPKGEDQDVGCRTGGTYFRIKQLQDSSSCEIHDRLLRRIHFDVRIWALGLASSRSAAGNSPVTMWTMC
jgi:hypothetical protein